MAERIDALMDLSVLAHWSDSKALKAELENDEFAFALPQGFLDALRACSDPEAFTLLQRFRPEISRSDASVVRSLSTDLPREMLIYSVPDAVARDLLQSEEHRVLMAAIDDEDGSSLSDKVKEALARGLLEVASALQPGPERDKPSKQGGLGDRIKQFALLFVSKDKSFVGWTLSKLKQIGFESNSRLDEAERYGRRVEGRIKELLAKKHEYAKKSGKRMLLTTAFTQGYSIFGVLLAYGQWSPHAIPFTITAQVVIFVVNGLPPEWLTKTKQPEGGS